MANMIRCKTCGAEIAANAKACPSCGGKIKKPFYKKWWVWIIAFFIVVGIASSGGNNDVSVKSGDDGKKEETIYNIGDVITTSKFEIKVSDVSTASKVGGAYFSESPSEGGIFVIVDWEYKNISDSPISSFSCPSIKIKDEKGTKYDYDVSATTAYATQVNLDRKVLSDLNPGISVKDAQVFEISQESYNNGGFKVAIDADKDFEIKIN